MSTYGGDSWVPETQYRKRRVDDLLGEEIADDEVRRMSNGRFACLVCPQCPVLDTMPMLHMHRRGARHRAAAEKQLFKKQRLHEEIQKRIALGKMVSPTTTSARDERRNASLFTATNESKAKTLGNNLGPGTQTQTSLSRKKLVSPPLTAWKRTPERSSASVVKEVAKKGGKRNIEALDRREPQPEVVQNHHIQQQQQQDVQQEEKKRRQRELQLLESGWMRDGTGGWYRDENVEFDSDEESPE